jgi:hypothetical protein
MRKTSNYHRIRDISDLRIQYFCEYRFFLKNKEGDSSTIASVRGEWLHSKIGFGATGQFTKQKPFVTVFVIAILLVILIWVFW